MKSVYLSTSNPDEITKVLKASPGEICINDFNDGFIGEIYYKDGVFTEDIWILRNKVDTISADTVQKVMKDAYSKYGQ